MVWQKNKNPKQNPNVCCFICSHPLRLLGKRTSLCYGKRHMDQGGSSCLLLFPLLNLGHTGLLRRGKRSEEGQWIFPEIHRAWRSNALWGLSANWSFLKNTPVERSWAIERSRDNPRWMRTQTKPCWPRSALLWRPQTNGPLFVSAGLN